jgi:hypothetical protein
LLATDAAGLVDALTGNDKLTVFAPTDEAFAKLPQATLDELAAKPRKLRRVLKYHVVGARAEGGRRRRAAVDPDARRPEDQGPGPRGRPRAQPLRQGRPGDNAASNGTIHVIDRVCSRRVAARGRSSPGAKARGCSASGLRPGSLRRAAARP